MKKNYILFVLFFFSFSTFAQLNNGRQVRPRLNVSFTPHAEFGKVAGNMNLSAGMTVTTIINDKYYYGYYLTKKLQKQYIDYGTTPGELDISFQHHGVTVGRYFGLGNYRSKSGRLHRRKTLLSFSGNIGYSVFWTANRQREKISSREYFYLFQPIIGFTRPVHDYFFIEFGVKYPLAFRIDPEWEESMSLTNKEFSGPAAWFSVRYNLFRSNNRRRTNFFL